MAPVNLLSPDVEPNDKPRQSDGVESPRRGGTLQRDRVESPNARNSLDLANLIRAVQQRWLISFVLASLTAVSVGAIAWAATTPVYIATAAIVLNVHKDFVLNPGQQEPHYMFVSGQMQLLTSPPVLQRAMNDPQVQELPEASALTYVDLAAQTEVENVEDTGVITISVSHPEPAAAQVLTNAVVDAYFVEFERLEKGRVDRRLETLRREKTSHEEYLQTVYTQLGDLAGELGSADVMSLALRQEIELESKRDYGGRLRQVQLELREARQQFDAEGTNRQLLASKIENLELEETTLTELLAGIDRRLSLLGGKKVVELQRVRREVELASDSANIFRRAIVKWEAEHEAELRAFLQSRAELPLAPNNRQRWALAVLCGACGATVVLVLVGGVELFTARQRQIPRHA